MKSRQFILQSCEARCPPDWVQRTVYKTWTCDLPLFFNKQESTISYIAWVFVFHSITSVCLFLIKKGQKKWMDLSLRVYTIYLKSYQTSLAASNFLLSTSSLGLEWLSGLWVGENSWIIRHQQGPNIFCFEVSPMLTQGTFFFKNKVWLYFLQLLILFLWRTLTDTKKYKDGKVTGFFIIW